MKTTALLTASCLLAFAIGCESRSFEDPPPRDEKLSNKFYPQSIEKDVDILFVIDNSGSMAQEQQNLLDNFGTLIEALKSEKLDGKIPNVHIGVVTTDLGAGNYGSAIPSCETAGGDRGVLQSKAQLPGCAAPTDAWISYSEGVHNISGCTKADPIECVKDSFKCIAALGIEGCGFEMQLESARLALDKTNNANPGFLRDEAFLAVVFITDEDDCSAANPQLFDPTQQGLSDPLGPLTSFRCFEFGIQCDINDRNTPGPRANCVPAYDYLHDVNKYIAFFEDIKGSKDRVIMAAIAGPKEPVQVGRDGPNPTLMPSCRTATGFAVPALRIGKVIESFEGEIHTICTDDFGPALKALGEKIVASLGGQCITSPLLVPNGGVACKAGVGSCKMPSCPEGTTCEAARGVCVDASGKDTSSLCGDSCLDKADCQLSLITGRGTAQEKEVQVAKCPLELFNPSVAKEQCGDSCPCWRIVPREADCTAELKVSPFGFEVMRTDEPAKGTVAVARCRAALFNWYDNEVQNAPFHCGVQ
ncbi:MAG: VWA domain-containing protein [Deltaproteobacteria bacterium]|nr:VWA domain-containing protein [Deltaproteobacteria bacterium]